MKFDHDIMNNTLLMMDAKMLMQQFKLNEKLSKRTFTGVLNFLEHADTKLADKLAKQQLFTRLGEKHTKDYKPNFDQTMIADPTNLNSIILESVRRDISQFLTSHTSVIYKFDRKSPIPDKTSRDI